MGLRQTSAEDTHLSGTESMLAPLEVLPHPGKGIGLPEGVGMTWLGRKRRLSKDGLALVEEATAFLTGHFTTFVFRAGTGTPAWAQVNFLAHGRPALLLRQFELEQQRLPDRIGSWSRVKSDILRELVNLAAGRPERIETLQRGCLIPLELRLMESPFWKVQPSDVRTLALNRLHAHPLALHHRAPLPPES